MTFIGRVIFTSTEWSNQIRFTNKFFSKEKSLQINSTVHMRERERESEAHIVFFLFFEKGEAHIVDREMVEVSVMQQHEHTSQY